jgi:hypothetical protein
MLVLKPFFKKPSRFPGNGFGKLSVFMHKNTSHPAATLSHVMEPKDLIPPQNTRRSQKNDTLGRVFAFYCCMMYYLMVGNRNVTP